jgi:hypothetical protein
VAIPTDSSPSASSFAANGRPDPDARWTIDRKQTQLVFSVGPVSGQRLFSIVRSSAQAAILTANLTAKVAGISDE